MKERMQKTLAAVKGYPRKDRLESEEYVGVQTFMWMREDNIVEVPFDKELERRGLPFVRYADDSMIFCKSKRAAMRVRESITRFIEGELYLKVNKEKTVVSYVKGVKYLGYSFYVSKGKCQLAVHPKSKAKLKAKLKELTSRSNGWGYAMRKQKLEECIMGWVGYYPPIQYETLAYGYRQLVAATDTHVYMEGLETPEDKDKEPHAMWHQQI